MLKYETSYKENFKPFIRVFDTELKKSKSIEIDNTYEYYMPYSKGTYTYVNDSTLKLEKYLGSAKDAKDQYGVFNPIDRYVRDNFWKTDYNDNPRIFYIDIETRSGINSKGFPSPELALEEICLIQIYDSVTETMYVLGLRDFELESGYSTPYSLKYLKFNTEYEMLEAYLKMFAKMDPLIIYAWNGDNFDYPYIFNRLKNLGFDTQKMSNYGKVKLDKSENFGQVTFDFSSHGHYYLDLMKVFKKFAFTTLPSYSLNSVGKSEVGETKIEHTEFVTFDSFYTGKDYEISDTPYEDKVREEIRQLKIAERDGIPFDKQKLQNLIQFQFVWYGIQDVILLKKIDNKRNLTSILINIACEMGCTFDEAMRTVRPWSCGLQNIYYMNRLVCPPKQEHESPNVVGGYVRDPQVGIHKWVMNMDVNSMYPMLSIKAHNMSPETFIPLNKMPSDLRQHILTYFNSQDESKLLEYSDEIWNKTKELLNKYNVSLGINGAVFDNSKVGLIPKTVGEIYAERKQDKKTMLKYAQQSEIIKEILKNRRK